MSSGKKYDLEDRLVEYAGNTILFSRGLPSSSEGKYFKDQMVRSASGAALNYGEAQGTMSKKDFVHKITLVLRELKETRVSLRILDYLTLGDNDKRAILMKETVELCAIFASIQQKSRQ